MALWLSRNSFRYCSVAADDSALCLLVHEFIKTPIHYGYSRVHAMLRREGWCDNHKPVSRLYCEQGLPLELRGPCRNKSAL
ncbi:IS3 family transposase [Pantoea ananatis]|uniref:IS3 family transposase n=1 Tax=Pantoea ananas TaxID=553 RepID=UPI0012D2E980